MEPRPLIAPPSLLLLPPPWKVAFLSAATVNSCERLDQGDATLGGMGGLFGTTFIRQSWYPAKGEASAELCPPTSLPHCASLLLSGMKQGWGAQRERGVFLLGPKSPKSL